ncbi:hypothetical protein SAMN02745130_03950 [Thiothrix eikelboomii]|uniref:Uncharacterized protein n=1 Tax=Thiothrix eikelboomii TaxID=92487 RepID=A0A1T4Y6W9_9GAMM|nr:hypothetical protein [Thiothrix eikelboomii]SKA97005.1 hypothetical protein SAMN02745130_03950 [Thiothrix eikelboomii]
MESFYYQNEEWVNLQETIAWIYYGRGNHEKPTIKNSNEIFEELKEALESKQLKAIRLNKSIAFRMEEGLFFNAGDVSALFKIELYLFYKTAVEHLEHFNQVIHVGAPNPIQEIQPPQQEPVNEKPKREGKAAVLVEAFMDAYTKENQGCPATAEQLLAFCLRNPVAGYSDISDSGGNKKTRKISFTGTRPDSILFVAFENAIRRD